jgi:hypothetical protein
MRAVIRRIRKKPFDKFDAQVRTSSWVVGTGLDPVTSRFSDRTGTFFQLLATAA